MKHKIKKRAFFLNTCSFLYETGYVTGYIAKVYPISGDWQQIGNEHFFLDCTRFTGRILDYPGQRRLTQPGDNCGLRPIHRFPYHLNRQRIKKLKALQGWLQKQPTGKAFLCLLQNQKI